MLRSLDPQKWVSHCPICNAPGRRQYPLSLLMDCTCTRCGWAYTSTKHSAVLHAVSHQSGKAALERTD
jgi:hypothetical protein